MRVYLRVYPDNNERFLTHIFGLLVRLYTICVKYEGKRGK